MGMFAGGPKKVCKSTLSTRLKCWISLWSADQSIEKSDNEIKFLIVYFAMYLINTTYRIVCKPYICLYVDLSMTNPQTLLCKGKALGKNPDFFPKVDFRSLCWIAFPLQIKVCVVIGLLAPIRTGTTGTGSCVVPCQCPLP